MIDVSFLGRDTARNPIVLKSPGRIERDAKWRGWKDRAAFAGVCILGALGVWALVAVLFFL